MSGIRSGSLRRNAIMNIVGRSASVVLWVLVTPYVLARLGQERFAIWSLFLGIGGNVASLDFGMSQGVARYVAIATARGDRANLMVVLRRSLVISAGIGLMWCVVCMAGRQLIVRMFHVPPGIEAEVARSLMVFAASMFVYSVTQVLNGALIGFQRLDLSNLCFIVGLILQAGVLLAGLSLGAGLISTAFAAIAGYLLSGAIASVLVLRSIRTMAAREPGERVTWREMLHFGGAVQGTTAFATANIQAWNYLLGILGQLRWVTEFALGFRVANGVMSIPQLIQGAVIPAAAHASAERDPSHTQLRSVYEWACRWVFAFSGPLLGCLWLAAPALVMLWLGPVPGGSTPAAAGVTRLLAITFAFGMMCGPATAVARGGGWPLLETWMFAGAFVIDVGLSFWLVPRYGTAGAALALGAGFAVAGAWLVVTLHRILHVRSGGWLVKMLLPRFVIPAATAVLLWKVLPVAVPVNRVEALRVAAVQCGTYALLCALLLWPTGDPAALLARLRRNRSTATPANATGGVSL